MPPFHLTPVKAVLVASPEKECKSIIEGKIAEFDRQVKTELFEVKRGLALDKRGRNQEINTNS